MLKKIRSVVCSVVCCATPVMVATDALATETGIASYYSDRFQGHKTASGEQYDRNKLTAAHRSLPIGSQIEVTNLKTHDSVIVTINDRGPYSSGRTLDLSYAAAKEIGLVRLGVAPIAINVLNAKDMNIQNVAPSEEIVEFEQLAKAEEVEEAEEEVVEMAQAGSEPNVNVAKKTVVKKHKLTTSLATAKEAKTVVRQNSKTTAVKASEHHQVAKTKSEADAKKAKHLAANKHQDKDNPKSEKLGKISKIAKADAVKHSADAKVKKATHHKT